LRTAAVIIAVTITIFVSSALAIIVNVVADFGHTRIYRGTASCGIIAISHLSIIARISRIAGIIGIAITIDAGAG
jgi:hypothetical protein